MKLIVGVVTLMAIAVIGHNGIESPSVSFFFAAAALVFISKIMGDATEHLAHFVGERYAGLVNVSLGNLAEIIILFTAVQMGEIELVKGGIVGSMFGNLLLVMGLSALVGCYRHRIIKLNPATVTLYINQLTAVGIIMAMPTSFAGRIPSEDLPMVSYIISFVLVGVYVVFYIAYNRHELTYSVRKQARDKAKNGWSLQKTLITLVASSGAAFWMSEILIGETAYIGSRYGLSGGMLGFMLLPLLGNIAEHSVAITAAWQNRGELSLAVAVGSASQVGMIVIPVAVLFGYIFGVPVTLDFSGFPFQVLLAAFIPAFIVLRDAQWRITEGIMLVTIYLVMLICFYFAR